MAERSFQIVGLTGDPSGDRRLDAAVRAALAGVEEIARGATLLDYADVGDAIRAARFRSQLTGLARSRLEALEAAPGLVVGVPIERGTVPGQFKHLFDLADPEQLRGKPSVVLVHRHARDDATAVRRHVEFLVESFGLDLVHEIVLVDRSQFASDGRLSQENARLLARAGRILALAVASGPGDGREDALGAYRPAALR